MKQSSWRPVGLGLAGLLGAIASAGAGCGGSGPGGDTTSSGAGSGGSIGSGGSPASTGTGGSGGSASSSSSTSSSSTTASSSSGSTVMLAPACVEACSSPADCASAGPTYDAAHFACTGGACVWKGCNSTAECTAMYPGGNYVCVSQYGIPYKSCYPGCSSPADCVSAGPINDAAHYACTGGACVWKGCNSTAECTAQYPGGNYVCVSQYGLPYKVCAAGCSSPADCATSTPVFDAAHYACTGGACLWKGCKSNAECTAMYPGTYEACH